MRPVIFDQFVELTKAENVPYIQKMLCCGAGLRMVDAKKAAKLVEMKIEHVGDAGADCLAVLCPFCMIQYDVTQRTLKRSDSGNSPIPIIYYPELLCLAMGVEPEELGLEHHRTSVKPLLDKLP
jgi:heterodisulfide reductase subunit B